NTTDIPEGGAYVIPQSPNGYVYYVNNFVNIYDGSKLGQLVIELEAIPTYQNTGEPLGTLFDYQVDLSSYPGTQYFVYDAAGNILFSSDAKYVGTNLTRSLPQPLVSGTGVAAEVPGYTVYRETFYQEHLFLAIVVPDTAVKNGLDHPQWIFLLSVCLIGVALLFVLLLLSGRLSAPLRALEQYCIGTREHMETPPVFDPVYREIEAAQEALAARAVQIQDMHSVIMKNHLKMKDNEIQLLQAQINPHFLFNMLDIIGWQAAQDQNQNVSEMVTHLGRLLRNNILLNNQEKITVGQEVQYIRDYLALEQIRHADRFTYTIDADEDLLASCYIPKLSLQPIVENCIVHGFKGLARPGIIEVRIWDDMDDIICTVRDNGVGFDAADYFERTAPLPPDPKRSHIALHNIQDRIHMLCGPQYGISIESSPGNGTLVKVTFPLDEKGGE
ncbi:MAG: sensor histidine kinase, partial [Intestinibacillus sp.]